MALQSRRVVFGGWFLMALAVAPILSKAQEGQDVTGIVEAEESHVFQPNLTGSIDGRDARLHSQMRQFWDAQTKQAMDANINNEEQRRREQGWEHDGGNVLDAMREIRDKAKEGSNVDAEELRRQASAARAKISRKSDADTPNSLELEQKRNEAAADSARGSALNNNTRAQQFLEAVKKNQEQEEIGKVEKEQQRVEKLRGSGNFMREHP